MLIPEFNEDGYLPAGIHWTTWEMFVQRFGYTEHRRRLIEGLKRALDELKSAGCQTAYVDGSFVTAIVEPGDYDVCWEVNGLDPSKLDSILLNWEITRGQVKLKYFGDIVPNLPKIPGRNMLRFFQFDRDYRPRGIIAIDLREFR